MGLNAKLLAVYDKLDGKVKELNAKIEAFKTVQGEQGIQGVAGKDGAQGGQGVAGKDGKVGKAGVDGKDGLDGQDGVSVVDVEVDIDGHLTVTLSDDNIIDAGSLQELGKSIAEATLIKSSTVVKDAVQYIEQPEETKRYFSSSFISGINIIGVSFAGNSIVEVPDTIEKNKIIKVKDETGANNTITITSWS